VVAMLEFSPRSCVERARSLDDRAAFERRPGAEKSLLSPRRAVRAGSIKAGDSRYEALECQPLDGPAP
jgi:hypothetical protein